MIVTPWNFWWTMVIFVWVPARAVQNKTVMQTQILEFKLLLINVFNFHYDGQLLIILICKGYFGHSIHTVPTWWFISLWVMIMSRSNKFAKN